MDDDRLRMVEHDMVYAIDRYKLAGKPDTADNCRSVLAEVREEIKRRAEGGPPT